MARRFIYFLLLPSLFCKVLSIYAQPTIQQYLHLTGVPHSHTITVPATQHTATAPNIAITNQPRPTTGLSSFSALALPNLVSSLQQLPAVQQNVPTTNHGATPTSAVPSLSTVDLTNLFSSLQQLQAIQQTAPTPNVAINQPRPTNGIPSFSALALPNLFSSLQQLPPQKTTEVKIANPSSIDSKLLNNLAIALQLLIVSNILNAPPPTDSPVAKPMNEIPASTEPNSSPYYSQPAMPNSNFVGTSSFAETNLAQTYRPTRNSMSLMSPYEALGANSPYSDPILSQSPTPMNTRKDFQSPYSMLADKDKFSMNDLF